MSYPLTTPKAIRYVEGGEGWSELKFSSLPERVQPPISTMMHSGVVAFFRIQTQRTL